MIIDVVYLEEGLNNKGDQEVGVVVGVFWHISQALASIV